MGCGSRRTLTVSPEGEFAALTQTPAETTRTRTTQSGGTGSLRLVGRVLSRGGHSDNARELAEHDADLIFDSRQGGACGDGDEGRQ